MHSVESGGVFASGPLRSRSPKAWGWQRSTEPCLKTSAFKQQKQTDDASGLIPRGALSHYSHGRQLAFFTFRLSCAETFHSLTNTCCLKKTPGSSQLALRCGGHLAGGKDRGFSVTYAYSSARLTRRCTASDWGSRSEYNFHGVQNAGSERCSRLFRLIWGKPTHFGGNEENNRREHGLSTLTNARSVACNEHFVREKRS